MAPLSVHQADQELARLREALMQAWAQIAELRVRADHDSLTGLANRRRLMVEIEVALERVRRHDAKAALVLMDMDRLKELNDCHGHQAGDSAIMHVARIISDLLPGGLAARLGGDEFALVLPGLDEREAQQCARKMADRLAASPLWCEDRSIALSISCGATAIDPKATARTLLARADAAMYADKRRGRAGQAALRSAR